MARRTSPRTELGRLEEKGGLRRDVGQDALSGLTEEDLAVDDATRAVPIFAFGSLATY
jgi:hypothetical protein